MARTPKKNVTCPRCGGHLARDNTSGRCTPCQAAERDRLIAPPTLPADFWDHQPIRQASEERHIGRLIRAYRCHPYHGRHPLPQETVARWLGITQAQMSRIENGRPIIHLDRLTHWAQILRIPAHLLWFTLPGRQDRGDDNGEKQVARRILLATGGALAAATLSAIPHFQSCSAEPLPAMSHALLRFSAVGFEPVGIDDLTQRALQAWRLRQSAHYDSLIDALPPLIHAAHAAATTLNGIAQEQAARVLVHTYNAAASLLKRIGDIPLALLAADRAVQTAQAIDDPVLVAAGYYRLANVLLAANRFDEAITVALTAGELVGPGNGKSARSLALWGGFLLTAAVAAARRGAHSQTWELIGEARLAARLLDTDHADIYSIFGPTNVAIHGVQVAVELGEGKDAVRRSEHVDPTVLPESLIERRGQFLIDLARGYALAGDDHKAVATLRQAEDIAPQEVRHSGEAWTLTSELLQRGRAGGSTGLRELADRLGVTR